MKVVAFNGSPRVGGNTELLLRRVLEPIAQAGIETELVQVGSRRIRGCIACGLCGQRRDRRCALTEDIGNECLEKMFAADAVLIGSPTYFAGLNAETKALIDRAGYVGLRNGGLMARKIGTGVVAVRRGGATSVLDSINHMFLMSRMIVPGSTYWNFGIGREKGEVENDAEGLANMRDLGETIAWLLPRLKG